MGFKGADKQSGLQPVPMPQTQSKGQKEKAMEEKVHEVDLVNEAQSSMANGGTNLHHIITIPEEWSASMEAKMRKLEPNLLKKSAGKESCCIFRAPQSVKRINPRPYEPIVVSIGPYHHGKRQLRMMEDHKWLYLRALLARDTTRTRLQDLLSCMANSEKDIRLSYSEVVEFDSRKLVEMMTLDGCFIIELFCRAAELLDRDDEDPIFELPWILPHVMRDLLRLENQIPFFVLQKLFNNLKLPFNEEIPSLNDLALRSFNRELGRDAQVMKRYSHFEAKHLLDLVCLSFLPLPNIREKEGKKQRRRRLLPPLFPAIGIFYVAGKIYGVDPRKKKKLIYSAEKLHRGGIRFKLREADSFLDIKYSRGTLEIPRLTLNDFTSCLFLNAVSFEQCFLHRLDIFNTYGNFMCRLINTAGDVGFLRDRKIMDHSIGTDKESVRFFKNACREAAFDIENSYLSKVFEGIDEYQRNQWQVRWKETTHLYFGSPWSTFRVFAVLALALTAVQSYYSAFPKK